MSVRPPIFFPNSYFADEYAVRGRRWMDCIGRMVMRPSDWEIASQWDKIIPYDRNQQS